MPAFIKGDLLSTNVDVIVQQCNCVTIKTHGLSELIAQKYPFANIYNKRQKIGPNTAAFGSRGKEGTCILCKNPNGKGPTVACLLAQICPGKPSLKWSEIYQIEYQKDNKNARLIYFEKALESLLEQCVLNEYKSIAFPFKIGSGLAGGNWPDYLNLIEKFEFKAKSIKVFIVQL